MSTAREIKLAEQRMCKRIIEDAQAFFADPKNQAKFEAWEKQQKDKEKPHASNHD